MNPNIVMVVAIAKNGVIGQNGGMPWSIPSDLKQFKQRTLHRPLIMGRKTFESLPGLLKQRPHIIISREKRVSKPDNDPPLYWVNSHVEAIDIAKSLIQNDKDLQNEIAVIGGAEIFKIFEPLADSLHITHIFHEPDGDVIYMPDLRHWKKETILQNFQGEKDSHAYEVVQYSK